MPQLDSEPGLVLAEPKRASKRSTVVALGWGIATALCAGGLWAVPAVVLSLPRFPFALQHPPELALSVLVVAGLLGVSGGGAGAVVGLLRGRLYPGTAAAILGLGGAFFGALAGIGLVLVPPACNRWVHPLVSSSLVWALMGFAAGVSGYGWSYWLRKQAAGPSSGADEEEEVTGPTVEWVLRGRPGRWRERAWFRVLPVLLASAWALVGAAAFAPSELSLGLLAVGVLGLSVALVLYNQERRLRELEKRFRQGRESGPPV